jgi:hypothetical protein
MAAVNFLGGQNNAIGWRLQPSNESRHAERISASPASPDLR